MENTAEIVTLLTELREENRAQKDLLRRQNRVIRVLCVFLACLVIAAVLAVFILLPQVTDTFIRLDGTMTELDSVLLNTQDITEQLKNSDIEGTITALQDTLASAGIVIEDCADSLSTALDNLNEIDFVTLNNAITDLYNVISPLANLFSR